MLEPTGRKSGRSRYVVLEVIDHPAHGSYVMVSGVGVRTQWFRNIQANPKVSVYCASRRPASAIAHRLDQNAAAASLGRYAAAHPRSWAKLRPSLEDTLGMRIDEHGTGCR